MASRGKRERGENSRVEFDAAPAPPEHIGARVVGIGGSIECRRHWRRLGGRNQSDGRRAADPDDDLRGREACDRDRQDRSLAARAEGLEAGAGDDQVRLYAHRLVCRRDQGAEGDQSSSDPQVFAKNALAVNRYQRWANAKVKGINRSVKRMVPGTKLGSKFTIAYGGVAARVPANKIARLLAIPGVVAIQKDTLNQPLDDNTSFLGATNVWPTLGGQDSAGSNVVVGVIDTGVWPENPYFVARPSEPAPPHPMSSYHCDFGDGTDVAHLGPTFSCNNKLIGAYNKTQTYMSIQNADGQEFCNNTSHVCSARDSEGHGTHTASTAAGDRVDHAVLYGVDRVPASGIAPGAHVIVFRVCMVNGCFSSDSVSSVQQAIHDGVNVINFSIGGGAQPYS